MDFNLGTKDGRLFTDIRIGDKVFTEDVTDFFEEAEDLKEWLVAEQAKTILESSKTEADDRTVKPIQLEAEIDIQVDCDPLMWQQIQDSCYHLHSVEPNDFAVLYLAKRLPDDIFHLANQWGWNDTEVRDKIYRFIEELTVNQ